MRIRMLKSQIKKNRNNKEFVLYENTSARCFRALQLEFCDFFFIYFIVCLKYFLVLSLAIFFCWITGNSACICLTWKTPCYAVTLVMSILWSYPIYDCWKENNAIFWKTKIQIMLNKTTKIFLYKRCKTDLRIQFITFVSASIYFYFIQKQYW